MDGTIEMLTHSSALIRNFRDPRYITDVSDDRLKEINGSLRQSRNKEKHLISYQERTY